jgi:hypothetical protein
VDQGPHAGAVVWPATLVLCMVAGLLQAGHLVTGEHLLMAGTPQQGPPPGTLGRNRNDVWDCVWLRVGTRGRAMHCVAGGQGPCTCHSVELH